MLADALTSVFAIAALLGGKYMGWTWLDAVVGMVGAFVIRKWALSLTRETARVLLDCEMDEPAVEEIREAIESDGDSRAADLHVHRVGLGQFAVILTVVAHADRSPEVIQGAALHPRGARALQHRGQPLHGLTAEKRRP